MVINGCPNFILDNQDYRLCNVRQNGDVQYALIFIPTSKRGVFAHKLQQYIDQSHRHTHKDLFDNINSIALADVESFWTSNAENYPPANTFIWWEVWLSRQSSERSEVNQFLEYCQFKGLSVSAGRLEFELQTVVLVKAAREDLAESITLISCLSELRRVVDTSHFILSQSPKDQLEWADHLASRTTISTSDISVLILDSGVNYNHPLLEGCISEKSSFSWDIDGSVYDSKNYHGTMQAGLIVYGDIADQLLHEDPIDVNYSLESCRIFNLADTDDKDFFGSLTHYGVNKLEESGAKGRVISLAVTAEADGKTGQPSSWSAEIDQLSFDGNEDRLFIVSAGNIRSKHVSSDYETSTSLFSIENPAQSWNCITVGAYTEKVDVSELAYKDWQALVESGGISPTSRTSLNWDWIKQAPYKPDVVEEGGNLLLSPDGTELTNADCMSLVTTADPTQGALFCDHAETSAAAALVSRTAATIWADYPELTPETIRALITHSASWTRVMWSYIDRGIASGLAKKDAKEMMLRRFGHGVPSMTKARESANSYVTMIHEGLIKPYHKTRGDLSFNEMHLIELPWPKVELEGLGGSDVRLRITLSYFIEPNPGRRAYADRFRYQSHGLRFKLINLHENVEEFLNRINLAENDYTGGTADTDGWDLGAHLQTRGSLHQDTWSGSAIELADRNYLAVQPVAGWWKQRVMATSRTDVSVRYSLVVSIDAGDVDVDIYSPVMLQVKSEIDVEF